MQKKDYTNKVSSLLINGYDFSISGTIKEAWDIVRNQMGIFFVYGILGLIINVLPGQLLQNISFGGNFLSTFIQFIVSQVFNGIIVASFVICAHMAYQGKKLTFADFFRGFIRIPQYLSPQLLASVFIFIGLLLLVIPGIYLIIAYSLVIPYCLFSTDKETPFQKIESVRKVLSKNWFSIFVFFLLAGLVLLLGVLALGVGIFISYPVVIVSQFVLFKNIFGLPEESTQDDIYTELKTDI